METESSHEILCGDLYAASLHFRTDMWVFSARLLD